MLHLHFIFFETENSHILQPHSSHTRNSFQIVSRNRPGDYVEKFPNTGERDREHLVGILAAKHRSYYWLVRIVKWYFVSARVSKL